MLARRTLGPTSLLERDPNRIDELTLDPMRATYLTGWRWTPGNHDVAVLTLTTAGEVL